VTPDHLFAVFMPVWAFLGLSNAVFYWKAPLAAKRRWHLRIVVASGLVFATFLSLVIPNRSWLAVLLPALAAICYMNFKLIRFCGSCGATLTSRVLVKPARFCQRCGASLDQSAG